MAQNETTQGEEKTRAKESKGRVAGPVVDALTDLFVARVAGPASRAVVTAASGALGGVISKIGGGASSGVRKLAERRKAAKEHRAAGKRRWRRGLKTISLSDPRSADDWNVVGEGRLDQAGKELRLEAGSRLGLAYYTGRRFDDFRLRLRYRPESEQTDMTVAVRFLDPRQPVPDRDDANIRYSYDEPAYVAAHTGFEVQLGAVGAGREPGTFEGIVLGDAPGAQLHAGRAEVKLDDWNQLEIEVRGDAYAVRINGHETARFENPDAYRGKPASADPDAGHVGLLMRKGRMTVRDIEVEVPREVPKKEAAEERAERPFESEEEQPSAGA